MAVAFESIGYPDTILPGAAWAKAITLAGGGRYGVAGAGDWRVTRKVGADRTAVIAPGTGWGEGVVDTTVLADELPCGTVAAGTTRYDMVVARRTWGATNETEFAVVPGSSVKALPARAATPGTVDEQPLALLPVIGNGGGGILGDPIDLRVWQQNGGAVAQSDLVRSYLDGVGTSVRIAGDVWQRMLDSFGNPTWVRSVQHAPLNLLAVGAAISPTSGPPQGFAPWAQAGTAVLSTNEAGQATIVFPTPFPTGVLTVLLTPGDDASNPDYTMNPYGYDRAQVSYRVWGGSPRRLLGSQQHRVNWFAIGW